MKKIQVVAAVIGLSLVILFIIGGHSAQADTLVVNSTADSGAGTLRQALLNAVSGDTITFDPVVFPLDSPATILLTSGPLPWITQGNLTIDATSAGVILNGSALSSGHGFYCTSNGNVIKGLQILNFPGDGIRIEGGASFNIIGGSNATPGGACTGECNVISGNGNDGVWINGSSAISNTVSGNYIGTDASGTAGIGNANIGIAINGGAHNVIGGHAPDERNVVSANGWGGISVSGASDNRIIGNYLGTDVSGMATLGNTERGMGINDAGAGLDAIRNLIRGNLISGNGTNGIDLWGGGVASNTVSGNLIGTDATGMTDLGNGGNGMAIGDGAHHNTIGGSTAQDRNIISGNDGNGIWIGVIWIGGTGHNAVSGNYIGTNIDGTAAVGNSNAGVWIDGGAQSNLIGGDTDGEGNLISGNQADGVLVLGYDTLYNTIRYNRIYSNTGSGISLVDGGNLELPPPILSSVSTNAIYGLTSPGNLIEIFSDAEDEGRYYHGSTTADASGHFTFTQAAPFTGTNVTATATDDAGNTSEFSLGSGVEHLTIWPNLGGNAGPVSVVIHGCGFPEVATAKLVRAGHADIIGAPLSVSEGGWTIVTTFDLTGKAPGTWDVAVVDPGGDFVILSQGFIIEESGAPQLWADVLGRDLVRVGREATFHLVSGNAGNVDFDGLAFIAIRAPTNVGTVTLKYREQVLDELVPLSSAYGTSMASDGEAAYFFADLPLGPGTGMVFEPPVLTEDAICITPIEASDPGEAVHAFSIAKSAELYVDIPDLSDAFVGELKSAITDEALKLSWDLMKKMLDTTDTAEVTQTLTLDAIRYIMVPEALAKLQSTYPEEVTKYESMWADLTDQEKWEQVESLAMQNIIEVPFFVPDSETCFRFSVVGAMDPNEKVGAQGTGKEHYLSGEEPLRYAIFFENLETATAPAQEVVITDQLDLNKMNLSTFSFGPIVFGSNSVTPPLTGLDEFTTDVDLRPDENLIVRVNASLDRNTGLLTWDFMSIDPETGELPEDPLAGFLPPNISPPEGEGSVIFTIMPRQSLRAGTEIRNQATIIFDTNPPIDTQEWLNVLMWNRIYLPIIMRNQ